MVLTSTQPAQSATEQRKLLPSGLEKETLVRVFRLMYLSRCLDDREILLKRQNRIFFQISAAGHEAVQIAAGLLLRPGHDWVFSYYRDRALALTLGITPEDMLLQAVGAARDPNSGGRQMPSHWSSPALRFFTGSSPTGTQFVQAMGCALGKVLTGEQSDEVTFVSSGEGATSEGEFWEAMNAACLDRLPLVVLIEDNGYAISVPVEYQTAGGNIARLLAGFPGLLRIEVDGTDFLESYSGLHQAFDYVRSGHGPALVHASVIRPYSHSLSDDERLYKPPAEREREAAPEFEGEPRTMVDAINQTLAEEMRRDHRVIVFGQDVADCSREENLPLVKGKGGVFKATANLQREFGSKRCFNTPIAEASIIGRAIGLAVRGLKPVAEIQFFDYIWPAMMQLRDEVATIRWRSHNGFSCPMVVRVPIGGYLTGGAIYHSQCGEVAFTHIPGLRVVFPSNALDACGLLRTAIRCDDPVLFLEHKKLYREPYNRAPHPGADFTIPFGKAKCVKTGSSLTIVTYGALVQKSLQAAMQIEQRRRDISIEIIDLRTLSPYDWNAIAASVKKTNRVLVVNEDMLSWGYGAEIAARIADELFTELDAPVGRVAALDTWVAYSPRLEEAILPQVHDIVREAERLLAF